MSRQKKPPAEKQEDSIRVKVSGEEKATLKAAAEDDGMDAVSVWLKWLARRRIREQARERGRETP